MVSLKDFLPQNVEYVSSQPYISTSSSHTNQTQQGVYVDVYGNMTLAPGVEGYILVKGKVLSTNQNSLTNKACIYLNDTEVACDYVSHRLKEETKNLKIEKFGGGVVDKVGDQVVFTLKVTNNGSTPMSEFTVVDTLPAGLSFVARGSDNGFASFTQNGKTLTWANYTLTLQPGASTTITFTAKVDVVGTHRNVVCLQHPEFPSWGSYPYSPDNCDTADVVLEEEPEPEYFCVAPTTKASYYLTNSRGEVDVPVTCRSHDDIDASIVINCGNGDRHTSPGQVASYSATCSYSLGEVLLRNYTISCVVNGETRDIDGRLCEKSITLEHDKDVLGFCGDGSATHWEDCDCKDKSHSCSTNRADLNRDKLTTSEIEKYRNSSEYLCKNCKVVSPGGPDMLEPIACFNTNNGSISINKGEMLPFYWNIEKVSDEFYTESSENTDALSAYTSRAGRSCSEADEGKIPLNAMVCNFRIYNGRDLQSQERYVYALKVPCFTK